jgi:hypothetical protein
MVYLEVLYSLDKNYNLIDYKKKNKSNIKTIIPSSK